MGRLVAALPFPTHVHRSPFGPVFIAEFTGAWILAVTIVLATAFATPRAAPVAIGASLTAAVYAFGHYSKAHFNPSATLAFFSVGVVDRATVVAVYLTAEFTGVFAGALSAWALLPDDNIVAPHVRREGIRGTVAAEFARVWFAEFVFTFLLVMVIMNVAASKVNNNDYYGVVIGLVVTVAGFTVGPVSGAVLNPAVALGLHLARCIASDCHYLGDFWIYWAAEISAALAAVMVFLAMHGEGCGGGCDCSRTNLRFNDQAALWCLRWCRGLVHVSTDGSGEVVVAPCRHRLAPKSKRGARRCPAVARALAHTASDALRCRQAVLDHERPLLQLDGRDGCTSVQQHDPELGIQQHHDHGDSDELDQRPHA